MIDSTNDTNANDTNAKPKRARKTDRVRDAFMRTNTQAEAARVLGVPGKWLRNITRDKVGVYVSKNGSSAWDAETKARVYDLATARLAKRTNA